MASVGSNGFSSAVLRAEHRSVAVACSLAVLAPVEHVLDEMQRRVCAFPNRPVTLAALD